MKKNSIQEQQKKLKMSKFNYLVGGKNWVNYLMPEPFKSDGTQIYLVAVHQLENQVWNYIVMPEGYSKNFLKDWILMAGGFHLKRIHKVFNQEEAAHLLQGSVDVGQTAVHVLPERLWWDADILFYQWSAEREEDGT